MGNQDEALKVASPDEIRAAYRELSEVELLRLRKFAEYRTQGLERVAGEQYGADSLIVEALCRALTGRRKWNPNKINFFTFFAGTLRSVANQWYRHLKSDKGGAERDALGTAPLPSSPAPAGAIANSPEQLLIREENRLAARQLLSEIERSFLERDDSTAVQVLHGLIEGFSPAELRSVLNLSMSEWETVYRRVERRIKKHAMEGDYHVRQERA